LGTQQILKNKTDKAGWTEHMLYDITELSSISPHTQTSHKIGINITYCAAT